jgi:hypothetical protein
MKGLFIKCFGGNGTRIGDRKIGERKSWQVSLPGDFKDTLGEDGDQFDPFFLTFLIDSLNSFEASAGRKDIDLFGEMMRECIPQKKGDG